MKVSENPKVSIIMGIYNCENTLEKSIKSIINQTYENWELIMCDDSSKDNTFNVAKKYADKYPDKIKLIKNNENLTLGPTLNRCIELVEGKYIARQDGDDLSTPDRLEKQVKFLEENKGYDLVGTSMSVFDERGIYGVRKLKEIPEGKDMMRGSVFCHATVLIKTSVMKKLEGYSHHKTRKQVEDYDLWFRFFEHKYKGYNLQEALYEVREDRDAYKRKNMKRRINEIKVMIDGAKRLKLPTKSYIMILKPIIAGLVPQKLLMAYHKNKFKVSN